MVVVRSARFDVLSLFFKEITRESRQLLSVGDPVCEAVMKVERQTRPSLRECVA